jgi:ubiquinone/menaquinone biosynthesis C-methylase UbiE
MPPSWTSYDSAATTHDSVLVPKMFAKPAAVLIERLDVAGARQILDAGTGSGVAARAAREAAPGAFIAGVDPAIEMLKAARTHDLTNLAVAALPVLPFANATFDRVMASFVLSHLRSYEESLAEMVRVLRPAGRLGFTAWGAKQNDYRELWDTLCTARMGKERMDEATRHGIPWEDWLTDPEHVRQALTGAGLESVEVHRIEFDVQMTLSDFLVTRARSLGARYMRSELGDAEWERFWQGAVAEFERRFAREIVFTRDVLIGIGRL